MENMGKTLASSYAHGFGINFGNYINSPHIYKKHMETLRTNVFKFKEEHTLYAQVIIFRRRVASAIDSSSLDIVYVVVLRCIVLSPISTFVKDVGKNVHLGCYCCLGCYLD